MKFSLKEVGNHWYKGNLHTHTIISDGSAEPSAMVKHYRDAGWDFLAITDHARFGCYESLASSNFLILGGVEGDVDSGRGTDHVVALGDGSWKEKHGRLFIQPDVDDKKGQELINRLTSEGGLTVYCHPIWSRREFAEIENLNGFNLLEIYNHQCEYENRTGCAVHYWDSFLRQGRRIWGAAVDDSHGIGLGSLGGWVVVRTTNLSSPAVLNALENGHFYSSMGPEIFEWKADGAQLYIACSPVTSIHFIAYEPRGKSFHAEPGQNLSEAVYHLKGNERFVRAECQDSTGRVAWTNPIFFS